jgi:hypothetical protein
VHTSIVKPARKVQAEYDMNISGDCQVNSIFLRTTYDWFGSLVGETISGRYFLATLSLSPGLQF